MYREGDSVDTVWQRLLSSASGTRVPHGQLDDSSLDPLRDLLRLLGDPQDRLRCVHIAGSKGKGSTAFYLEQALLSRQLRVGVFTSPHLQTWTERFRLQGDVVSDPVLLRAVHDVAVALHRHAAPERVRFFDRLVAIALQLFAREAVDWSIVETGIGGLRDATNVIDSKLAVITSIEREHNDVLGESIPAIARHKAGIVKPGSIVVSAVRDPSAARIVQAQSRAQAASVLSIGDAFAAEAISLNGANLEFRYRGTRRARVKLRIPAPQQADNAAAALAAFEVLCPREDLLVPARALDKSMAGRCELLPGRPGMLLDVAHTPASLKALAAVVQRLSPDRLHLLIAASSRRHLDALAEFAGAAAKVVVTQADDRYSVTASAVAEAVDAAHDRIDTIVEPDPERALRTAMVMHEPQRGDLVCVTGSTYLVGRIRPLLTITTD